MRNNVIGYIDVSLKFINDLFRNLLDMNRASSNQLSMELAHTGLLRDVLEPVASLMHPRWSCWTALRNLIVMTVRSYAAEAVLLDLGRNASTSPDFNNVAGIWYRSDEGRCLVGTYDVVVWKAAQGAQFVVELKSSSGLGHDGRRILQ
jgi:hypothetical protein